MAKVHQDVKLSDTFRLPLAVLLGIVAYLILGYFGFAAASMVVIFVTIILGSYGLFRDLIKSIMRRQYALDYIASLAIIVSIITGEYLVAAIIGLMITSGRTLEEYGISKAKRSLTKLLDRKIG